MSSDVDEMLGHLPYGILVGRQVMRVGWREYLEWMQLHKYAPRAEDFKHNPLDLTRVGWDEVGSVEISTVFLGIDHGLGFGRVEWFETMVFGGGYSGNCWRYATWDEALGGHQRMVAAVREGRALEDIE